MLSKIHKARDAGAIKRFHTARLIQGETVAEHSFNLVNLIMIVTNGNASRNLILAAITHDLGEYAVGDIPSPIKRALPKEVAHQIDLREEGAVQDIHPCMKGIFLAPAEAFLLSLADKLDGLLKCIDELRMGNRRITTAGDNYCNYIIEMCDFDAPFRGVALQIIQEYNEEANK